MNLLSIATLLFYLGASARLGTSLYVNQSYEAKGRTKNQMNLLIALGLICHAILLLQTMFVGKNINIGFYNAGSLISFVITVLLLLTSLRQQVENLTLIFLPMAAIAVFLSQILPAEHMTSATAETGMNLHITLSLISYSLFAIAAVQALLLAYQERQLRSKRPGSIMNILPPLRVMESLLFQLIATGFACLTLGLLSGALFVDDLLAQHLLHKTVLSVVSWMVFGTLLWGHWQLGWRGPRAIRWTLAGFALLMLAYFGTKMVLELILDRA